MMSWAASMVRASAMPRALMAAHARTSTGVDARPYTYGAAFMPAPNPMEASPKTNASSARLRPSKASSGFRNKLNA